MSYTEIRVIKSDIKVYTNEFDDTRKLKQTPVIPTPSLCKKGGKAGVYIWGFYYGTKFHPLYVGKTGNLYERLIQHYCRLRGGEYQMFDINDITSNKVPRTLIYEPQCFNNAMVNYQKNFKINSLQILDNFAFRYVLLSSETRRRDGEKYLTEEILKNLCGSPVPKNIKLKDVLLSGKRGAIRKSTLTTSQMKELDKMIADI